MSRASLRVTFDSLTPGLKKLQALGGQPKPVLEVGAVELKNITTEAFSNPGVRPASWPDKKDGTPSNLTDSTTLSKSISLGSISNKQAKVETDRLYAAVHQFGSDAKNIPARPFFPFVNDRITPEAHRRIEAVMQKRLDRLVSRWL